MEYDLKKAVGYFVLQKVKELWWLPPVSAALTVGWFVLPYIDKKCTSNIYCHVVYSFEIGCMIIAMPVAIFLSFRFILIPWIKKNWNEAKDRARRL